jgi:APA family basic amino acid/polyamine antiporter
MARPEKIHRVEKEKLRRVLGVWDLFGIGYGDIGSSIYYALGVTALFALGATPLALALAGFVFVCTSLTYSEMTSCFHESGGSSSFARHAFNDLVSFIAGWALLLDYIVTIAISIFTVGPYLAYFYPPLAESQMHIIFSIAMIVVLFVLNYMGVRQSSRMSLVLTGSSVIVQAIIVVIGIGWILNLPYVFDHIRIGVTGVDWSPTWPQFWKGTAMAMVAYIGIESIAQLGSESKRPAKYVPRAIMIVMGVLLCLYMGLAMTTLSVVHPHALGTTYLNNPLAGIVDHMPFGQGIIGPLIGIVAASILFVAANAGLVGASRLAFNMGEYYQLPRLFHTVHPRFRTPHIALAFFAVFAAIIILFSRGNLDYIADLYNFGAMAAFFFAHISLIAMRIKRPDLHRPFKVRLNIKIKGFEIPITAIIGALVTAGAWILVVLTKPEARYLGFGWMAFGIGMYLYYRRKKKISAAGSVTLHKVKIPHFKPLKIKTILVPLQRTLEQDLIQIVCQSAKHHNARLIAVDFFEIPSSMPLDAQLTQRQILSDALLGRVEAIAREYDVQTELRVLRTRSTSHAILELAEECKADLIALPVDTITQKNHAATLAFLMKKAPCRVWLFGSEKGKG